MTSYAFESGRIMLHSYRDCNAGDLTLQVLHIAFKEILVYIFSRKDFENSMNYLEIDGSK